MISLLSHMTCDNFWLLWIGQKFEVLKLLFWLLVTFVLLSILILLNSLETKLLFVLLIFGLVFGIKLLRRVNSLIDLAINPSLGHFIPFLSVKYSFMHFIQKKWPHLSR